MKIMQGTFLADLGQPKKQWRPLAKGRRGSSGTETGNRISRGVRRLEDGNVTSAPFQSAALADRKEKKMHKAKERPMAASGFVRAKEAARWMGCCQSTFWTMASRPGFPVPRKLSTGYTLWSLDELREWIDAQVAPRPKVTDRTQAKARA
jgi:predicted DNA-binding transcriptional regulator AlpA